MTGIKFRHGILRVYHNAGTQTAHVNPKTCFSVFTNVSQYWVVGGTGRYHEAEGWGTAHIRFSGIQPKKGGKCDMNANPLPGTTHTTFLAKGPVALDRH